ncbi:chorismate synthase [SAR202 cluster bacterium AC-409-J13_OGT_754m]|nr:chorismate synthase [SAR202 cluster bacterium AC-409-J13_OGT_754m]
MRFLTAGESHGEGLVVLLEGMPAGLEISENYIGIEMTRRQKGYGRGGRMEIEQDMAHIVSGVRHGRTLGSPISMTIENKDWVNWTDIMSVEPVAETIERITRLRPGHADLPGTMKYGYSDVRNVLERASARETAARVAAGAIARRLLEEFGINLHSHSLSIGGVWASNSANIDWDKVEKSPVRCADSAVEADMMKAIDDAKEAGDTVGGVIEVVAEGLPIGLGSHVQWDRKIDGRIAQSLMSIPACKAVSIGDGWESVNLRGSEVHDVIEPVEDLSHPWQRQTNRSGGTEGGMTSGMPLVARFAIKPISTLRNPLPSVDLDTGALVQAHYERSDVCQVPPAGVIGEAMVALVLADAFMEKFGGDSIEETRANYRNYMGTVGPRKFKK